MSKKDRAIEILTDSAKVYDDLLKNKSYLIISYSNVFKSYRHFEIVFNSANFMHLTGVDTRLKPSVFYKKCLNNRLSKNDFELKNNGTTMLKLELLPKMFELNIYRTIGDYSEFSDYIKIEADIAAGNNKGTLALKNIGNNLYIPCSLLRDSIDNRISSLSKQKITYIYSKNKNDNKYRDIIYEDKKGLTHAIPDEISQLIIK